MPIIRFETVSKEFTPESYGLKEISFAVDPGEMVFITGHSGSGKTTLMRLLTKEYTPSSGDIFFHEEPLSDIGKGNIHHHRRRIGVVFQDYRLVSEMNVWENIALPLYVTGKKEHEIEQRVTDLLNLIKLPDKADQFPSQLSGGEAQRVSIARALAIGPEVIFADEPTGNLDPDTSRAIARLLLKINELGTTILIATHDQEVLRDHKTIRQIILEKGSLIKDTGKQKPMKSSPTAPPPKKDKDSEVIKKSQSKTNSDKETAKKDDESSFTIDLTETMADTPVEVEKVAVEKKSVWGSLFGKKTKLPDLSETNDPEITESKSKKETKEVKEKSDTK